ncbi:zinc finger protein Xfin-like [Colias croceus]|uniref:zinc finger protein Xfin-like n=1 Tax=Colias crocea TaxID=72248 RepID=UPI001E27D653|nr:zinc finger protein Xfin-like [Colias croceus]
MLQQMSLPPSAQAGEVATLVRSLEGRMLGDASSEASSDAAEDIELPDCKIKRNYSCTKCKFYTQNPRAYLLHSRDVHFERIKIYECPYCIYASRHNQKLIRHVKMVHEMTSHMKSESDINNSVSPEKPELKVENMEDLLEEIEEIDDIQIDVEDCNDESVDRNHYVEEHNMASNTKKESKTNNKFYTCQKCSYVTHIKTRYTKHVKYHSLPMIKCTVCDFRTPYKWNLDRHMKNHGGGGSFHCTVCNFTTDIRQSMTVHEINHHSPHAGIARSNCRRNRVGGSDLTIGADDIDEDSLIMKEEESCDSQSSPCASDMGIQYIGKEMINCNSDSNEGTTSDILKENMQLPQHSPTQTTSDDTKKQCKKIPRPIPQLIPLSASTPNKSQTGEPPAKKFKESVSPEAIENNSKDNTGIDITLTPVNSLPGKEATSRKKNESFFDKLKERLLTETGEKGSLICKNCGFESKCLSEHSVHEKTCTVQSNRSSSNTLLQSLSSTRCQNCRHRCKSSADLINHLKTCGSVKGGDEKNLEAHNQDSNEAASSSLEKEVEPHPMENVVFVWNNIDTDTNKFDTPLGININDDCTLPENKHLDPDLIDDNETMNLSPSQAVGKKVFKCPHCMFWAATASRFHVHIVAHLNRKPFECSLCKYKSNWRWDITKHIKLKSARDPDHAEAKVLMTDETGRRNYSKYNKFLAMPVLNDKGENEFHYVDPHTPMDTTIDEDTLQDISDNMNSPYEMQPLNLQTQQNQYRYDAENLNASLKKPKKTIWKCKKCNYKDSSKEALLEHVREHSRPEDSAGDLKSQQKKAEIAIDPADLAYRCGHCNQLSNWKHVIQRHCRLKHDGIINVITTLKPKPDPNAAANEISSDKCSKCPFTTTDKNLLAAHLQHHQPSPQSIFKCYFCPYFVKDEQELIQHLVLHGVNDPEEYISKALGSKSPLPDPLNSQLNFNISSTAKRHKCSECPYETNSKSQFMYHEQFHRYPTDTAYKCTECNYSVSKRHLLHQHLRVHGIVSKKGESDIELETTSSSSIHNEAEQSNDTDDIPYVWVSAKDEFHKMYKCRYCSYVNAQRCKIPNHEQIHFIVFENSDITVYKCLECKFTCDNKTRLADHSKSHGEIYGRIYCPVDIDIPDEEQMAKLRKVLEKEKSNNPDDVPRDDAVTGENKEIKTMYFCQKCPARYFSDNELRIHDKFHDSTFPYKCKTCEFSVPQESELEVHNSVHTDEYNTKSKMLKFMHKLHPAHKEPRIQFLHCQVSSEGTWVVSNPSKNFEYPESTKKSGENKHTPKQYFCKECPAKFFKTSALNYHVSLHGGEGDHKCKKCSYTVKNIGNLAKHELLHENEGKTACDYESGDDMDYKNIPLSGTDLFQRKTEAQKRVLTDKDKLVKPNDHFPPVLQADPQFGYLMHGNPEFIYPTYLKNGRQKEKRYKCHKCPSAFEKREQYKIHLSLHGSKQRYKCELCDYSVKYYANYVQHMRKHQMNDEAQAERKKGTSGSTETESDVLEGKQDNKEENIKLAIKTMPKRPKSDFQQFSISDQQTLRLLQRKRSINSSEIIANDPSPTKDRKIHMCLLCPYTNQRQDALHNHYKRHDETEVYVGGGNNKCSFCDLVVIQSHFLREHLKTHFHYMKNLVPESYIANEDVSFTINKLDEEDEDQTEIKIDLHHKRMPCNGEKTLVRIQTGELMGES